MNNLTKTNGLFQPIIVEKKKDLVSLSVVNGQFIVVIDTQEIFLDKGNKRIQIGKSQDIYVSSDEPSSPSEGQLWFKTEKTQESSSEE